MSRNSKIARNNDGVQLFVCHQANEAILPRMLNIKQCAWYMGLAEKTVRNKLSDGTFPVRPKSHCAKVLFDIRDIDRYLDSLPNG